MFEILRYRYSDHRSGVINETDKTLAADLGVHPATWRKYSRLLVRAGLLRRRGRFRNDDNDPGAGWEIPVLDDLAGRGVGETFAQGVRDAVGESLAHHRESLAHHKPSTSDDASREVREVRDKSARASKTATAKDRAHVRDDVPASTPEEIRARLESDEEIRVALGKPPNPRTLDHALERVKAARKAPRNRYAYARAVVLEDDTRIAEEDRNAREAAESARRTASCPTCGGAGFVLNHADEAVRCACRDGSAGIPAAESNGAALDRGGRDQGPGEETPRGQDDCARCDANGFVVGANGAALDPPLKCSHDDLTEAIALLERELGAEIVEEWTG